MQNLPPPYRLRSLFEVAKGPADFALLQILSPFFLNLLPKGDGHPVLFFPGFTADDMTTAPLRRFITKQGYRTEKWKCGANFKPTKDKLERIEARLHEVYKEHGKQPVSLVGWSLGGFYARALAHRFPDRVEKVISLGTPFQAALDPGSTIVGSIFRFLNPDYQDTFEAYMGDDLKTVLLSKPDAPTTSVYTREDGVVNWRACTLPDNERTENIEVSSSHLGIGFSPRTAIVLADRLAQPSCDQWQKFNPGDYEHLPTPIDRIERHAHHQTRGWHFGLTA